MARPRLTADENLRLIRRIEASRKFLLTILSQNPALLARAEPRVQELLKPLPADCDDAVAKVGAENTAP
jgi:hypothetical protein